MLRKILFAAQGIATSSRIGRSNIIKKLWPRIRPPTEAAYCIALWKVIASVWQERLFCMPYLN